MHSCWVEFVHVDDPGFRAGVLRSLSEAEIAVLPRGRAATPDQGRVFFGSASDELVAQLPELSRAGVHRVIAVAMSQELLGDATWRLLANGVSDVLVLDDSTDLGGQIAARFARWANVDQLLNSPVVRDNLIGSSPTWVSVLRQIVEMARFSTASVLLMGETGTGKELAARVIHTLDARKNKGDIVILDCTTVVRELAGSEFFGHERGAFTGAVTARDGAFSLADRGTLFLDEVGELPLELQAQLLRVIQHGTYRRVGSNVWRSAKFRLLCATNRDLQEATQKGTFRSDLYHRITTHVVRMPPLRERTEDILILVRHFMRPYCNGEELPKLDETVRELILTRPYPGNVRELQQFVARIMLRHVGPGRITVGDLPPDERPAGDAEVANWLDDAFEQAIRRAVLGGVGLEPIGRAAKDAAVRIALQQGNGHARQAAELLSVTERAIQMRRTGKSTVCQDPQLDRRRRS